MFGWFIPKSPLNTGERTWVEWRMLWLADRFGLNRMKDAQVVLPTSDFFPEPYRSDYPSTRICLDRVCHYMGVDPTSLALEILADGDMPGAAGMYEEREKSLIYVAKSQLDTPPKLIATLAHEVAHELLLKGGHLTRDVVDHEPITDLLPVFLGLGIFTANATVQSSVFSDGQYSYFSISKHGYLSSISLGYALALFATVRGELKPTWKKYLRTDAAHTLRSGIRYLRKTNDSLLSAAPVSSDRRAPSAAAVASWLDDPRANFRLAALWDIRLHKLPANDLLSNVESCLYDRDRDVRFAAIQTLAHFGNEAERSVPALLEIARDGTETQRLAALDALGHIARTPGDVIPAIIPYLLESSSNIVAWTAYALSHFGPASEAAVPLILAAIERESSVGDVCNVTILLRSLRANQISTRYPAWPERSAE